MNVRFEELRVGCSDMILPQLFEILYENMTAIASTGCSFEADRQIWLNYIMPRIDSGEVHILLMFVGEYLAGYFQYSIKGNDLWAEEVEIKPEFQRTKLFYLFCNYLISSIPMYICSVYSYVNKNNRNSLLIHEHLGMKRIDENSNGTSWLYCGNLRSMVACLRR